MRVLHVARPVAVGAGRLLDPGQRQHQRGEQQADPQRRPEQRPPGDGVPAPGAADRLAGLGDHRVGPGGDDPVRRRRAARSAGGRRRGPPGRTGPSAVRGRARGAAAGVTGPVCRAGSAGAAAGAGRPPAPPAPRPPPAGGECSVAGDAGCRRRRRSRGAESTRWSSSPASAPRPSWSAGAVGRGGAGWSAAAVGVGTGITGCPVSPCDDRRVRQLLLRRALQDGVHELLPDLRPAARRRRSAGRPRSRIGLLPVAAHPHRGRDRRGVARPSRRRCCRPCVQRSACRSCWPTGRPPASASLRALRRRPRART